MFFEMRKKICLLLWDFSTGVPFSEGINYIYLISIYGVSVPVRVAEDVEYKR